MFPTIYNYVKIKYIILKIRNLTIIIYVRSGMNDIYAHIFL